MRMGLVLTVRTWSWRAHCPFEHLKGLRIGCDGQLICRDRRGGILGRNYKTPAVRSSVCEAVDAVSRSRGGTRQSQGSCAFKLRSKTPLRDHAAPLPAFVDAVDGGGLFHKMEPCRCHTAAGSISNDLQARLLEVKVQCVDLAGEVCRQELDGRRLRKQREANEAEGLDGSHDEREVGPWRTAQFFSSLTVRTSAGRLSTI